MKLKPIIITLILLVSISAKAQTETQDSEPKIGLVLSGGGAKGFAHIGVLKVIDSLGIKIDYVAGTSMGAIVGSLYASGYSGKQLEAIFKEANFDDLISDNIPRAAKTFYERENDERYALVLPFDSLKIKLPSALSRGQNAYGLLSKNTMHVSNIEDFSELPIPFFCIATNVETGKQVILDKGNLAQSVMASGAFPSLFQPVTIDGNVLIDGGVVNNYPIDELKAKGMDFIIGVDVQDDLLTKEALESAPKILLQINNYRTIRDMEVKSKKTDLYIKPDISKFNVVSFSEIDKIVNIGHIAAIESIEKLKAVKANQKTEKRTPAEIKPIDSITINKFTIVGNKNYTRAYVLGKLKLKSKEKVSYEEFNQGVNNLVATNNFDSFLYSLQPSRNAEGYDMYAHLKESDNTTFLKLALHYDDLYKSAVLVNLTKKRLISKNDVMSFDFILGDNIRYDFEYYIDNGFYWSVGLRSKFNEFSQNIPAEIILSPEQITSLNVNKLDLHVSDFTNQFYLQTLFRKDFSLTLGAEHKKLRIKTETIITDLNNEDETVFDNNDYFSLFGGIKFDTYDDKYFPTSGFMFDSDFHLYFGSSLPSSEFSSFSIAQASVGYSQKLTQNISANLTAQGGFTINEINPYFNFVLGGYGAEYINNLKPFVGYDFLSIPGDSYVGATFTLDYEIFKKNHVNFIANVANIEDDIFQSKEWLSVPDYTGYALGYALETVLGPVEVKYSWSPEANSGYWFFNLGYRF